MDSMIVDEIPLTIEDINKYIENNKENNEKKFEIKDDYLYVYYQEYQYKFKYKNYNKNLLELLKLNSRELLEEAEWNNKSMINFFDDEDVIYIKYLLKKIVSSKLFKIWKKYSKVEGVADYFFSENENIDELLDKIYFYKFR